jgi:predicted PurR-regulated permease PerM
MMTANGDSQKHDVLSERNAWIILILLVGLLCGFVVYVVYQINNQPQQLPTLVIEEQITITNMTFAGTSNSSVNTIVLTLKNTGIKQVTIGQARVNNIVMNIATANSTTILKVGDTGSLTILNVGWVKDNLYNVALYDSSSKQVGGYEANAPGS